MHFSSVFTREDTCSLPVPETKFNGSVGRRLGQLVVTPEVVASKINNMKENKSPGVDGISPKILRHDDSPRVGASVGRLTHASTSTVKNASTSADPGCSNLPAAAHCTILLS